MREVTKTLGVAVYGGSGWCAAQHIAAFQRNPHTRLTWIVGRDAAVNATTPSASSVVATA